MAVILHGVRVSPTLINCWTEMQDIQMLTTDLQDTGQSHRWNATLLSGFYQGYAAEQCTACTLFREAGKFCNPKAPYGTKWDQLTPLHTSQPAGAVRAPQQSSRQISVLAADHPLCASKTQAHQSRVGCPQNSTWARSEGASAAPAGVPGTDSPLWEAMPAAKGLPTRAPWLCCHRVIGYFPTRSASSPGQQDRDAAETSSFQRITPRSGEVCNFWQSQDGLCKGKKNFSAPSPTLQPHKAQP